MTAGSSSGGSRGTPLLLLLALLLLLHPLQLLLLVLVLSLLGMGRHVVVLIAPDRGPKTAPAAHTHAHVTTNNSTASSAASTTVTKASHRHPSSTSSSSPHHHLSPLWVKAHLQRSHTVAALRGYSGTTATIGV